MDYKRTQNLLALSKTDNLPDLLDQIKNDVDYDMHCAIGLGKRMPKPEKLNGDLAKANLMRQKIYDRLVEIW